ncbi:MAG: DNA methyltransferase, partial [Stackebrandtia sp.]
THMFASTWQAVLYAHGPDAPPLRGSTLTEKQTGIVLPMNSGVNGGRLHAWQKPDALGDRLIRLSTEPGHTVIDPFAGTGSFLVNAGTLGRHAQGAEVDPDMLASCEARGVRRA